MENPTYPFPLAVNSSHHSHYHRFLLGADPEVLDPFPKPYCLGQLAGQLRPLAQGLDLQRWRKLYSGSFPWTEGFGPAHYALGNVPPHRALPPEYCRPARKFAAYDFVQVADPSLSALGLVAGDRRIIAGFSALADGFCLRLESGACSRARDARSRATGRILAGQFAEPNNRWLMPFLHVHSRVLNFTSSCDAPAKLDCLDAGSVARAGRKAARQWNGQQADLLNSLGYRASVPADSATLRVEGVCPRLVASIQAPRIAVLRMLERAVVGSRTPCVDRLAAELPPAVIASMAERLESLVARSLARFKPAKIDVPSEGPWRVSVREHLSHYCPGSLEMLDREAVRAKAAPIESAVFPVPQLDPAHVHAPSIESMEARIQLSCDPELGSLSAASGHDPLCSAWLAREFEETLREVNERNVRAGPVDPLVSLRRMLATIDNLPEGADREQLRQSEALICAEFGRPELENAAERVGDGFPGRGHTAELASLDELFEDATRTRLACEHEIGGRSL